MYGKYFIVKTGSALGCQLSALSAIDRCSELNAWRSGFRQIGALLVARRPDFILRGDRRSWPLMADRSN
jgi:hypothetical protein